jgi:hypothetical protein
MMMASVRWVVPGGNAGSLMVSGVLIKIIASRAKIAAGSHAQTIRIKPSGKEM